MDKLQQVVNIIFSPFSQTYIPKYQAYSKSFKIQDLKKLSTFSQQSAGDLQTALSECKYLQDDKMKSFEKPLLSNHILKITPMPPSFNKIKATSAFQASGYSVTHAMNKDGSLFISFADEEDLSAIRIYAIKKVEDSQKLYFEYRSKKFLEMLPKQLVENMKEYCLVAQLAEEQALKIWTELLDV
ncbi:hypothetical protein SS50377_26497 [Spironucleus salmonicida]|uniref:Uncharacterized protein n=1 Tax=Spironucleus salmonicida TaxID=348837 RepID=V6LAC7_9EUKA|nr:hypothetical protein SS50377_26497 [Spironucleus salmonicida]|eukprot:EST41352.1 Hypothetical protein SS50377_19066 [Spironucleus salmonicida]